MRKASATGWELATKWPISAAILLPLLQFESSIATAYTGVSRTYPAVERYLIHLAKSERHSLHDSANQRNPERDKEEIPLESEELQLSLTPQDIWQTGL